MPHTSAHADDLSCRELVELVTEYLEGALPEPVRADFEAHLSRCPACVEYLGQIRRTVGALGRLNAASLSSPERVRLLALFRNWRAK